MADTSDAIGESMSTAITICVDFYVIARMILLNGP